MLKDIEIEDIDPLIILSSEPLRSLDHTKGIVKVPTRFDNKDIISYINNYEIIMTHEFIELIDFLLIKDRNIYKEIINKIKLEGDKDIALSAVKLGIITNEEYERWFNIITFDTINVEGVVFTLKKEYFDNYFANKSADYYDYSSISYYVLCSRTLLKNGHKDAFNFLVKNQSTHYTTTSMTNKIDKSDISQYIKPNIKCTIEKKIVKYCTLEQFIELFTTTRNKVRYAYESENESFPDGLVNATLNYCRFDLFEWVLAKNEIKTMKTFEEHYPRNDKYHVTFMKYIHDKFPTILKKLLERTSWMNFDYYTSIEELTFLNEYNFDKFSLFRVIVDKNNLSDLIKFYELFNIKSSSRMIQYVSARNNEEIFDYVTTNNDNSIHSDIYPIIISSAYNKSNYIKKLSKLEFPIHYSASLQASKNGHCDVLKTLFELKAPFNKDCLLFASEHNHPECVDYLKMLNLRNPEATERNWTEELKKTEQSHWLSNMFFSENNSSSLFGPYNKIGVPYKLKDVEEFEKINCLTLPQDFKYFITNYSRSIGWGKTNDSYYQLFNIYDVKVQDLFELCYKIDTTDDKHKYFLTINHDIHEYADETTRKYNYYKVPIDVAKKYFDMEQNRYVDNCFKKYLISGDVDSKLTKIKKINTSEQVRGGSYDNYNFWWKFDSKNKRMIRYRSQMYKLKNDHVDSFSEPETYSDDLTEISHKSRKLKIADGGCTLDCCLLLDGIFKGKIYLTETYFNDRSYGTTLVDSFTDFIIMENCR